MKLNLKNTRVIGVIGIFLISFLSHYVYSLFPNTFTSFFFPVNESIWEHMKILFTSSLLYGIIDYIIIKKNNIKFNNFPFALWFTSIAIIPIYLVIYLPLYNIIGENLIISIVLLFIIYIIKEIISYNILKAPNIKRLNNITIPVIIIMYTVFIYLTYYPPHNYIFYDIHSKTYGIKKNIGP